MEKQGYNSHISVLGWVIILLFFWCCQSLWAIEVAVNNSVPLQEYSIGDIRAVFTMKKRTWSNGHTIQVYSLKDNHPVHKEFVKSILQLFPYQLRRIWDRLIYSETGAIPIEVDSEQEMLDKLFVTQDAIGYLEIVPKQEAIYALKSR